jgi:hypothetical protein
MTGRKIYRTMQGRIIDLDQLVAKNELTTAVGNARVNARGDELGPGGRIVRKREDIMAEYYENNPNSVPDEVPSVPKVTKETQESTKETKQDSLKKNTTLLKKEVKDDIEDNKTDS